MISKKLNLRQLMAIASVLFFAVVANAKDVDIRASAPLTSASNGTASYTLSINECDSVANVKLGTAGSGMQSYSNSDSRRDAANPNICLFDFTTAASDKLNPVATITYTDGTNQTYSETFAADDVLPSIVFKNVSITGEPGKQVLSATVTAADNLDIQYVGFNVSGLRASDLRTAGGVITDAKKKSFAQSNGIQRVYPIKDDQNEFSISLPINQTLTNDVIANDAIVLVDAFVVDAYGNQNSFSKVAFTGDSISEAAKSLIVSSNKIIINNSLQAPVIKAAVDFQFRGIVDLSGPGNGIDYLSSNPDLVNVTSGGVIYALKETGAEPVTITVTYTGLPPVKIPVEVNFSKKLVGIQLKGFSVDHPFVLDGLNGFHNLPELEGVFDDGSRAQVATSWTPVITIRAPYNSILETNRLGQVKSKAVVTAANPSYLDVSLKELPGIASQIAVVAKDSVPMISLDLPPSIQPPDDLVIKALATDDVGITDVQFLLDGAPVGNRPAEPFELIMPISEELEGRTLTLSAIATDSAGQKQQTVDYKVQVAARPKATVPDYKFELPADSRKAVEKSPITAQISHSLGILPDVEPTSGISQVEFFFDGAKVGEANFPMIETRTVVVDGKEQKEMFELWLYRGNLPAISTNETSMSISATVHGHSVQADAPAKLVRIIKNTPPTAHFTAPVIGTTLTVAQDLPISVEATDDTLILGTRVDLYLNDKLIDTQTITGERVDIDNMNSVVPRSQSVIFHYVAKPEQLGDVLKFQAKVIDFHQELGASEILKVSVKGDQPPTVAIANPTEGASFVSGLPIPIRAEATDDLKVDQVDFYVNGILVGSDKTSPYAFSYDTPKNIEKEQILTISAVATDSAGHKAESNKVKVTLGHDEESPVINIASPEITKTDAGKDVAFLVENSEFVLKAAGYDNVGVKRLGITGIRKDGIKYTLTGNDTDVLTDADFPLQQIPGALRAFSALRLMQAPAFSNRPNIEFDLYHVTITAYDEVGNHSQAAVDIQVGKDKAPEVVDLTPNRTSYFPLDTVALEVLAKDDKAVQKIDVKYTADNKLIQTHVFDSAHGLAPMSTVQVSDSLDLAAYGLINKDQTLRIDVIAYDALGQASAVFSKSLPVLKDAVAPIASISEPIQGTTLYQSETVTIKWKAVDDSRLASVVISANGQTIDSKTGFTGRSDNGTFGFKIPANINDITLSIVAADVYGNSASSSWHYDVGTDKAPVISIRQPAAGSRFVEGEGFTINALVSDDRMLKEVTFFTRVSGRETIVKRYVDGDVTAVISANQYFNAFVRTPNNPHDGSMAVGVRAIDNSGQVTEQLLDLDVADDLEPPSIQMSVPDKAFSLFPAESFDVSGTATDNYYVADFVPYFVDEQGKEIKASWEIFSRTDRVEQVRIPNPGSLGSILVAEKIYTDYKARVRIPVEFAAYANRTLAFKVRASDFGINNTDSPSVNVTIKADTEAPKIQIKSPGTTLVDRQKVTLDVAIVDNVSIKSYKVTVIDSESRVLLSDSNINSASFNINNTDKIDLARYLPLGANGAEFSLVVEATDTNNNTATQSQTVKVLPDAPPIVSVVARDPAKLPGQGSLAFYRLKVEDDSLQAQSPILVFPFYSSLSALSGDGSRHLIGGYDKNDLEANVEHIQFGYPEAGTWAGAITLNDKNRWVFGQGKVDTFVDQNTQITSIKIAFTGVSTDYELQYRTSNLCGGILGNLHISAAQLAAKGGTLFLSDWLPADITDLSIRPVFTDTGAGRLPTFLKALKFELGSLPSQLNYTDVAQSRSASAENRMTLMLADNARGTDGVSFVQTGSAQPIVESPGFANAFFAVPASLMGQQFQVFAIAIDRMSKERGLLPLSALITDQIAVDEVAPVVSIAKPQGGTQTTRRARIPLAISISDNSSVLDSLQLFDDRGYVAELGGVFGKSTYEFIYDVPDSYRAGELNLSVTATDRGGRNASASVVLPIVANEVPQLALREFASYKVDGTYRKVINQADRLNYGEFWLRVGENFRLTTDLTDDAGLKSYTIARLNRDGSRVVEYQEDLSVACPKPLTQNVSQKAAEVLFNQAETIEYEVLLEDNVGQIARRSFLVHPLNNVAPEVRITAPAKDQFIVAGTFQIKVGVVAADDRLLSDSQLELYANGVRLQVVQDFTEAAGGAGAVSQAFDSIYDAFEHKYSVQIADEFGKKTSAYTLQKSYVYAIPSGLIKSNENIVLTAQIKDSDGSLGRDEVSFIGAADEINPEVALVSPSVGYGPPEFSDFEASFRGYDNVKVARLEMYTTYGVKKADGSYQILPYGAATRTITGIPDNDADPVTTNNVDTPLYAQQVHVKRMAEIVSLLGNPIINENVRFDIWIKVVAYDYSGNQRVKEVSYPVRVDQRPVVDILQPLDGSKQVEKTPLYVNVNAYDDVGIDSLRLVAYRGTKEIFNQLLRQPPYNFSVPLPAANTDGSDNVIRLAVNAIDTYGAAFGDSDAHHATEEASIELIGDTPPMVSIGKPTTGDRVTEGEYLLVQVNAVDDVGVDKVVLNVGNLVKGDRSFTDTSFPYEFLVEVPYGQAGHDLTLTAAVTEKRPGGTARTVATLNKVIVGVDKDTIAPEITLKIPAVGAAVVEKHSVPYDLDARDNVRVSSVRTQLFVDKNLDNRFDAQEEIGQSLLLAAPYTGSLSVGTIASYLPGTSPANLPNSLSLLLRVTAIDGAGNTSVQERALVLNRNTPPQVQELQILDANGSNLGAQVTEVTSGRGIVVNVVANDAESGISSSTLWQAQASSIDALKYSMVSTDSAAPFQFHVQIPQGHEGEYISFRAKATDVDGNESELSSPRTLKIVADKPPTAHIIKPSTDQSVIIDGQSLDIAVDAQDDLGADGIDRVAFFINGKLAYTAYASQTDAQGTSGQNNIYRATIDAPQGVDGFAVQAVAYDVMGHEGASQIVHIGKVADTVAPKLNVLQPFNHDILTTAEELVAAVSVTDIGVEADRHVSMTFIRESQTASGEWSTLDTREIQLFHDENPSGRPAIANSDPDNNYYIYWAKFADGNILRRGSERNERVRIIAKVKTPNHEISSEDIHEVGMPVSERRFLQPALGAKAAAQHVYYNAVQQFKSSTRTGAMVGAWSTIDPSKVEPGIGLDYGINAPRSDCSVCTGLFLADVDAETTEKGDVFVYSDLLNGASEIFAGTISEVHADSGFVLASKQGGATCLWNTRRGARRLRPCLAVHYGWKTGCNAHAKS